MQGSYSFYFRTLAMSLAKVTNEKEQLESNHATENGTRPFFSQTAQAIIKSQRKQGSNRPTSFRIGSIESQTSNKREMLWDHRPHNASVAHPVIKICLDHTLCIQMCKEMSSPL